MLADDQATIELANEIDRLRPDDVLAIDTETTGVNLYLGDTIRGISIAFRDRAAYIPVSHPGSANVSPGVLARLAGALNMTRANWTLHNASFDWVSLAQVGINAPTRPDRYRDTQVVAWAMDENGTHALKGLAARTWGDDEKEEQNALKALFKGTSAADMYKQLREEGWPVQAARMESKELAVASRKNWATLTAEDIAQYAVKDAQQTLRLRAWQEAQLAKGGPTDPRPDLDRQHRLQSVVARMVDHGVMVDLDTVRANREKNLARMWEIEPMFEGVNLNSPKQLGKLIYDDWGLPVGHWTKTGARSTSREALEELEGAHEGLDTLIEYRRLAKSVGTYYDNLIARADSNGIVHTGYCTTCTVTGRLSSRAPNLMNLPREDTDAEVKKVFRARPGMELWEFDLKSAELFVGASVAQDTAMLATLSEEGRDFHTETAMAIFGSTEGNRRTLAKNMNYGIPYGIGGEKFAAYVVKGTGKPVNYCRRCSERSREPQTHSDPARRCDVCYSRYLVNRHRMAWPQTHVAIDRLTAFAREHGYVPLHKPGRFRHFRSAGIIVPYYTAFNAIVQGGVALIMSDVMLEAEAPLAAFDATMVLQVHDSLWIELHPGSAAVVAELLQEVVDGVNPFHRLTWDNKRLA